MAHFVKRTLLRNIEVRGGHLNTLLFCFNYLLAGLFGVVWVDYSKSWNKKNKKRKRFGCQSSQKNNNSSESVFTVSLPKTLSEKLESKIYCVTVYLRDVSTLYSSLYQYYSNTVELSRNGVKIKSIKKSHKAIQQQEFFIQE